MDEKQKIKKRKKSQRERGGTALLQGTARACFGTGYNKGDEVRIWTKVGEVRRSTRRAAVGAAVGVKGHCVLV